MLYAQTQNVVFYHTCWLVVSSSITAPIYLNISAHRSTTKANDEMPESEILVRSLCESRWSIDGACLAAKVCNSKRQAHFFSKFLWSPVERLANLSIVICYGNHFKIVFVIIFVCDFSNFVSDTIFETFLATFASGDQNDAFVYQHALRLVRFTAILVGISWDTNCIGPRQCSINHSID